MYNPHIRFETPFPVTGAEFRERNNNRCTYCGEIHDRTRCPEFEADMAQERANKREQEDWGQQEEHDCCGLQGANHTEDCPFDDEPF